MQATIIIQLKAQTKHFLVAAISELEKSSLYQLQKQKKLG